MRNTGKQTETSTHSNTILLSVRTFSSVLAGGVGVGRDHALRLGAIVLFSKNGTSCVDLRFSSLSLLVHVQKIAKTIFRLRNKQLLFPFCLTGLQ